MKLVLAIAALALVAALGWGFYAQSIAAPPRAHDLTTAVTEAWRVALPANPEAATQAYLDRVPQQMRARGEAVSNTRYWVLSARFVVSVGAILLFLFSGAAASLAASLGKFTGFRWLHDLIFGAVFFALLFLISLPIDVYAGFVRPRMFGFADRPFLGWLQDVVINWAVISAFYIAGLGAFMALLRRKPKSWAGWAGAVYLALASLYVIATPSLIEPLTNTYQALPDSPLKQDILAMARANGVPADNVYTANASRQSRLLNAHVSGVFGTARISIDDTTLNGAYAPGVLAVVGHEIGHYVMGHVYSAILISTIVATFGFLIISWTAPPLIARLQTSWRIADFGDTAGIAVFWLFFAAYGFIALPAENAFSRWQESRADLYGLNASQAPEGMAEFMIHDADTARLSPTPLDIFLFYDHPSDRARIEMAMRWRAEHLHH